MYFLSPHICGMMTDGVDVYLVIDTTHLGCLNGISLGLRAQSSSVACYRIAFEALMSSNKSSFCASSIGCNEEHPWAATVACEVALTLLFSVQHKKPASTKGNQGRCWLRLIDLL